MGARKKEVIEQEWIKIETALDNAYKKCKAPAGGAADLEEFSAELVKWKKLLKEAVEKVGKWGVETDPKRIAWKKLVTTRKTKMEKVYDDQEEALGTHLQAKSALTEIISDLDIQAGPKLVQAQAKLRETKETLARSAKAPVKKDYDAATAAHGVARNALKNAADYVTKGGAAKQLKDIGSRHRVKASDIDISNAAYKASLQTLQARFTQLEIEADQLGDDIEAYEREVLNRMQPASKNADPAYQRNLKKCMENYRDVLAFALAGVQLMKRYEADIPKLEKVVEATKTPQTVAPAVKMILKRYTEMVDNYHDVDKHIQETIRTDQSTFKKQAKEWGITAEDTMKDLKPLMDRAFTLNYQCKAMQQRAADRLMDAVESLTRRFPNSPEAKAAVKQLERA